MASSLSFPRQCYDTDLVSRGGIQLVTHDSLKKNIFAHPAVVRTRATIHEAPIFIEGTRGGAIWCGQFLHSLSCCCFGVGHLPVIGRVLQTRKTWVPLFRMRGLFLVSLSLLLSIVRRLSWGFLTSYHIEGDHWESSQVVMALLFALTETLLNIISWYCTGKRVLNKTN